MDIIFYIFIFIIGILFGSFYTLCVYRIPKIEDITHTRSYCPNCGHKLVFWDLIPVFSYIFLGGKCRYCKEKIRPRYFILELLSGVFFVVTAYLLNFNIENLTISSIVNFSFLILYFTFIILMAGIDKEYRKIEKSITVYGIIISIAYMVYLYIVEKTNIHRYAIYLVCFILMLSIDTFTLKKTAKDNYLNGIIFTMITMSVFTQGKIAWLTMLTVGISVFIYVIIKKMQQKINKQKINKQKDENKFDNKITVGYCLGIANIAILISTLIIDKFLI